MGGKCRQYSRPVRFRAMAVSEQSIVRVVYGALFGWIFLESGKVSVQAYITNMVFRHNGRLKEGNFFVPVDRVQNLVEIVQRILSKDIVSFKELERCVGKCM